MKHFYTKKLNVLLLHAKKDALKKFLILTAFSLLFFSPQSKAQGVAYPPNGANTGMAGNPSAFGSAFFGTDAGKINSALFNSFIGHQAGSSNTTGNNNSFLGYQAGGSNTTGLGNSFIGSRAGGSNTTGEYNSFIGNGAGYNNNTGFDNSFVGSGAGYNNTTGHANAFLGNGAGYNNGIGNNNSFVGADAGKNGAGDNNTFIGYSADGIGNLINATAIGYKAKVSTSNSLVLGGTGADAINVGIGTTSPGARLEVAGQVKITDGTQGAGKVLTSDVNGLAVWAAPAGGGGGSGWNLTGNAGTVDGTNFIGTTDNVPFNIRVNNQKAGRIDVTSGNTLYGYQSGNSITTGNYNTATGWGTLYSNTTGYDNTATGFNALYNNTTGYDNMANGGYALYTNTTGYNNMANGYAALYKNTSGINNMANGNKALYNNTTGSANIANGNSTLYNNTTGYNNTAIGFNALYSNITGNTNTAIGISSLQANTTGNNNMANGYAALLSNTMGYNNVALGNAALQSNTSGYSNTANGYAALVSNSTGSSNTALGNSADVASGNLSNATAIGNGAIVTASDAIQLGNAAVTQVFVGKNNMATLITGGLKVTGSTPGLGKVLTSDANGTATWQAPATGGWSLTGNAGMVDGTNFIGTTDNKPFNIRVNNQKAGRIDITSGNTFYGHQSGNANTGGSNNTATGKNALSSNDDGNSNTATGVSSLQLNSTGNNNTAIGQGALFSNTTGNNNTALGYSANIGLGNLINATAIGANALVDASNKIRLGNSAVTVVEGPVVYTVSDGRFKSNISESDVKGLEFIKKLRPVVYNFDTRKFTELLTKNMPDSIRRKYLDTDFGPSTAIRQSGFIAQEVEKAAQETGYNFNGVHKPENENDNYSLAYGQFVVPLVKAVQEQEQKIETQQKLNEQLQQRIDKLEKLLANLSNGTANPTAELNEILSTTKQSTINLVSDEVKIYPNPGKDLFTLSTSLTDGIIEVFNLTGKRIYQRALENNRAEYQLDLSSNPRGIYLVTISSKGKEITTKKLVIE